MPLLRPERRRPAGTVPGCALSLRTVVLAAAVATWPALDSFSDDTASPASYGLSGPVGPKQQACTGIDLYPDRDVHAAVAQAAPGSTFCFHRGTYLLRAPIIPRSHDTFAGAIDGAAILTGGDTTPTAIRGTHSGATNVRITGLVIEHFSEAGIDARGSAGTEWILEHNELRFNGWSGAEPAHITRGNFIHHNGVVGLEGGYASDGMRIENNELAFNNTKRQYATGDNGGAKFIRTTRLKVLHNYAHHNDGAGLWTDGNNVFTEYAFNRVEQNSGSGLTHEVSCDASIHHNFFRDNHRENNLWRGAEIYIHSSPNVEVFANEIVTGGNGIALRDSKRPEDDKSMRECAVNATKFRIRNVRVHGNRVAQAGLSGMVSEEPQSFSRANAKFDANRYVLPRALGQSWEWHSGQHDWARWQSLGQDIDGDELIAH